MSGPEPTDCPKCRGTGTCRGSEPRHPDCSMLPHDCVDCHGTGNYDDYAVEQMRRLRIYLTKEGWIS